MSEGTMSTVGEILWVDLTVRDAEEVRAFYEDVAGWRSEPVVMGDYSDFNMIAPGSGEVVSGICHAKGDNTGLPAQWLIYIGVRDLDASMERCVTLGGEIVAGPTGAGDSRMCVIQDPAGAVAALYQMAER